MLPCRAPQSLLSCVLPALKLFDQDSQVSRSLLEADVANRVNAGPCAHLSDPDVVNSEADRDRCLGIVPECISAVKQALGAAVGRGGFAAMQYASM